MSAIICRPCVGPLIAECPDDFGGGRVTPPVPTRQRVCNTEQIAACPDGSDPQVIPAGTFCTIVLNPTSSSIAEVQAQMDALALAQAESQVGDCCWVDLVWTPTPINITGNHTNAVINSSALEGDFMVSAFSPGDLPGGGSLGIFLTGLIDFSCGLNETLCHRFSGRFVNQQTGAGSGVFQSQITLATDSVNPNCAIMAHQLFNEEHQNIPGLGVYDFSFDFTTLYTGAPLFYRICASTTVYAEAGVTHTQSITGKIERIDCP